MEIHQPEPITHGGTDRGYKICKCNQCGIVTECTPSFDFFTTDSDTGPLICEPCLMVNMRNRWREEKENARN